MSPVDPNLLHADSAWHVPAAFAEGQDAAIGPPPAPGVAKKDEAAPLLPRPPRPPSGTVAVIRTGPFRGLRGVVTDLGHPRRVILETRVLGRAVSIEVDASLLDTDAQHVDPSATATPPPPPPLPLPPVFASAAAPAAMTMTPAAAAAISRTRKRVAAIIHRRAAAAGLSDAAYFREIIGGRAPRITRAEAASEAAC